MSKRRARSDEGESVPPPKADQNPKHDMFPSLRTRSGRRVRTPAAFLDSELPSAGKTSSRRTRKSVIQEESAGNSESGPEEAESSKLCTDNESLIPGMDPEKTILKVDQMNPSEVNEVRLLTDDMDSQKRFKSVQHDALLVKDINMQIDGNREKENHVRPETQVGLGSGEKKVTASGELKSNVKPQKQTIPLGKPKSGRIWKDRNKHRFSALLRDKPLRSSWEKKMEAKREKELVKKFSQQLKEEKAREKEEKRKRREENLERREANERKAEIVQVIRNTSKIKRMKKKQLRKIEKRDTLALLQKAQPRNQHAARKGSQ